MSLALSDVRRIANDVARRHDHSISVAGVTVEGGAAYAEVIVTLEQCAQEPCLLNIGIPRDVSEAAFERLMDERLRDHLASHRSERE